MISRAWIHQAWAADGQRTSSSFLKMTGCRSSLPEKAMEIQHAAMALHTIAMDIVLEMLRLGHPPRKVHRAVSGIRAERFRAGREGAMRMLKGFRRVVARGESMKPEQVETTLHMMHAAAGLW